ncbi:hypothetical protein AGLY_009447 [Aphis glycines]|uniref:Uncharacterized protein n=1 Tax=Aphis glycines TaxID=307491 RepID=A0A6G0THG3_APHGL|nr:hypothetical protein AGLY_009447 [Aphis glycines]
MLVISSIVLHVVLSIIENNCKDKLLSAFSVSLLENFKTAAIAFTICFRILSLSTSALYCCCISAVLFCKSLYLDSILDLDFLNLDISISFRANSFFIQIFLELYSYKIITYDIVKNKNNAGFHVNYLVPVLFLTPVLVLYHVALITAVLKLKSVYAIPDHLSYIFPSNCYFSITDLVQTVKTNYFLLVDLNVQCVSFYNRKHQYQHLLVLYLQNKLIISFKVLEFFNYFRHINKITYLTCLHSYLYDMEIKIKNAYNICKIKKNMVIEFESSVKRVSKFETLTSCAIASSLARFSASSSMSREDFFKFSFSLCTCTISFCKLSANDSACSFCLRSSAINFCNSLIITPCCFSLTEISSASFFSRCKLAIKCQSPMHLLCHNLKILSMYLPKLFFLMSVSYTQLPNLEKKIHKYVEIFKETFVFHRILFLY